MAKKFACGDVVSCCDWSTTANDENELFQKISEHAKNDHNMTSIPNEIIQKVKSKKLNTYLTLTGRKSQQISC